MDEWLAKIRTQPLATGAGADHGSLGGLSDDDHPQYVHDTGAETIAGLKTFSDGIKTDTIAEKTGAAGVTLDLKTLIKDHIIYPNKDYLDAFFDSDGAATTLGLDDQDYFAFVKGTNVWSIVLVNVPRFHVSPTKADLAVPLDMNFNDITEVKTLGIDSTPANDTCSGITAELTAGAALTRGDLVYYGADGKMEKALATAEATSRVAAIVESATIAENAAGTFLLQGFFEKEWNFGTVGAKIYLSDTSAGAHDETAPADTNECIVVIGIAAGADLLDFRPSFQAIVEHT